MEISAVCLGNTGGYVFPIFHGIWTPSFASKSRRGVGRG